MQVVDACEDGEFEYEHIGSLAEEAEKALSECEKFCFKQSITFNGTLSHTILNSVISTLKP